MNRMFEKAQQLQEQLSAWRRAIHRHPELGFDLFRTAEYVYGELNRMEIEAQTRVGKTGIVAHLGSGEGPVIAIRADMDALPIQETNPVEYASQIPGCMHACGHDAHTAILLGVAALLREETLPGTARLLFQPSEEAFDEEGVSGAPRMIEDGALDGVDAVIALHVDGALDTGKITIEAGPVGAAVDTFKGWVVGRGGHGAYPHEGIDPIWLTSHVLTSLYAIPSRQVSPLESCVVTVGVVRGGGADNVIPDEVYLEGTLRSYDPKVREALICEVERSLKISQTFGGDYRLKIERGYPVLVNDAEAVDWFVQVDSDLLSQENILRKQKSMGAEDFGYMTQIARGAMMRLGVKHPKEDARYLHTSTFDLDETALPIGAAMLGEIARRFVCGE